MTKGRGSNRATRSKRDRELRKTDRRTEKGERRARGMRALVAERERRDGLLDAGEMEWPF